MITIKEIKDSMEQFGYYAEEGLVYDAFNALDIFEGNEKVSGQDIFALCLEGPPGAGKTAFAETYTKLADILFDDDVVMVEYQCDATTGKTELFEDINISAAIRGDAEHVNIPGKLVEAINQVNDGKKVVLFIDEYDKAREETDAFLLQFLQSGKINSTQHGDLEVKEEYKSNLQVILCKNDMREELSGPLSRRIRILRLDYMTPEVFYRVANRVLVTDKKDHKKVSDGLINLVSLMYEAAYNEREIYDRLPSCSEMLIALQDANRLMKQANAPKYVIYDTILRNMFKSADDMDTFNNKVRNNKSEAGKKLKDLITELENKDDQVLEKDISINLLIAEKVFKEENKELVENVQKAKDLIEQYTDKFKKMEEKRSQAIEKEISKIALQNGSLVSHEAYPEFQSNFIDRTKFIRRGKNILDITQNDWTEIGTIHTENMNRYHYLFVDAFKQAIGDGTVEDALIYENGFLIAEDNNQKLIVVKEKEDGKESNYKIMTNYPVIPSIYLDYIAYFVSFITNNAKKYIQMLSQSNSYEVKGFYYLNTLLYNDEPLCLPQEGENIYHLDVSKDLSDTTFIGEDNVKLHLTCNDVENAVRVSNDMIPAQKKKVL